MSGWVHVPSRQELLEREELYAAGIVDWLNQVLPELRRENGTPHPAAVAAVVRLHGRYGKGTLTVRQHGETIRGHVAWWEREFGERATQEAV